MWISILQDLHMAVILFRDCLAHNFHTSVYFFQQNMHHLLTCCYIFTPELGCKLNMHCQWANSKITHPSWFHKCAHLFDHQKINTAESLSFFHSLYLPKKHYLDLSSVEYTTQRGCLIWWWAVRLITANCSTEGTDWKIAILGIFWFSQPICPYLDGFCMDSAEI
jgi:hypothetical protein